jgi:hypothetical protein
MRPAHACRAAPSSMAKKPTVTNSKSTAIPSTWCASPDRATEDQRPCVEEHNQAEPGRGERHNRANHMRRRLVGYAIDHPPREDTCQHDADPPHHQQHDSGAPLPRWLYRVVQAKAERYRECTSDVEVERLNSASRPRDKRADGHPHMAVVRQKDTLHDDQRGEPYRSDDARERECSHSREPLYFGVAVDVHLRRQRHGGSLSRTCFRTRINQSSNCD